MNKKCACDMCDIDFSDDNGYRYVLDELKTTRAHIDAIINTIEMRIKKDAIIDEVLSTDYEDEEDASLDNVIERDKLHKDDVTALDSILKAIAINNAMNNVNKKTNRYTYPWWSIYPNNTWF